jgi:hypothetical protein
MNRSALFVVIVLALVGYTAWTVQEVVNGPLQNMLAWIQP